MLNRESSSIRGKLNHMGLVRPKEIRYKLQFTEELRRRMSEIGKELCELPHPKS